MDSTPKNIASQPVAKYFIVDTFKITGRGLVFAGHITEGEISSGDIIEFIAFGTILYRRIIGIEGVLKHHSETNTGILIKCENEAEIDKLKKAEPNNQVALVFKSETHDMNIPHSSTEAHLPKAKKTWWQKFLNLK